MTCKYFGHSERLSKLIKASKTTSCANYNLYHLENYQFFGIFWNRTIIKIENFKLFSNLYLYHWITFLFNKYLE